MLCEQMKRPKYLISILVLILVLMEYALRVYCCHYIWRSNVLILVLMEYALRDGCGSTILIVIVLILVLMEYALRDTESHSQTQ